MSDANTYIRSSIAMKPAWNARLQAILERKEISLAEQIRRWVAMDEWLHQRAKPDSDAPLYVQRADGTYERVVMFS